MNITKDVINDLLPLYTVNECSNDTRQLVDDYLQRNPREAEELSRILSTPITRPNPSPAAVDEMRSFRKARRALRVRSFLLGLAIFFSLTPCSFISGENRTYWLLRDNPKTAIVLGALGVICWIAYAAVGKRSRIL